MKRYEAFFWRTRIDQQHDGETREVEAKSLADAKRRCESIREAEGWDGFRAVYEIREITELMDAVSTEYGDD